MSDATAVAGPELDAEVHRLVFGITDFDSHPWHADWVRLVPFEGVYDEQCSRCGARRGGSWPRYESGPCAARVPRYSTDIAAAWKVVECLAEMGQTVNTATMNGYHGAYVQSAFLSSIGKWIEAETMPLAICRAALALRRSAGEGEPLAARHDAAGG